MRNLLVALAVVSAGLAGCIETAPAALLSAASEGSPVLTMELPIHVVAVGFRDFDEQALLAKLQVPDPIFAGMRHAVTGDVKLEPLQYDVKYRVHQADPAFAEALFAYAATVSEPAPADAYLRAYDRAGERRICPAGPVPSFVPVAGTSLAPPCEDVDRIDAAKVEAWLEENRAAYELSFPGAGYTIFVLDSYSTGGLPQDRYHQYIIEDGTTYPLVRNMRAWGGSSDFVFLDAGAAPNAFDAYPWANISNSGVDLYDLRDGPIWEYEDDMGTFYENLARNVRDATRILWTRTPIYPFEYAETYVLPTYIFIDPNAHANPASPLSKVRTIDYEAITEAETIHRAFQELVPWAEVKLELKFVYLPTDDPKLAAVLQDAKSRAPGVVDFGVVKKHFRENWDEYAPDVPGARVYPTFAFVLDAPSQGLYAYSDSDERGESFGVFVNAADTFVCTPTPANPRPLCFTEERMGGTENWQRFWNFLLIHELGHSFGLTHPHDTFGIDEKGYSTYELNWLWDSTSSPMTYRHALPRFNRFDVDLVHRGNAVNLAADVLAGSPSTEAQRAAAEALERIAAGDYAGGFARATEAKRLAESGLSALAVAGATLGEPKVLDVQLRAPAASQLWNLPVAGTVLGPATAPLYEAAFPIDIPEGAVGVALEYAEKDAPSHRGWGAFLAVGNEEGDLVIGAWNNAHDVVHLLAPERCASGCTGYVVGWGNAPSSYTVRVTPILRE